MKIADRYNQEGWYTLFFALFILPVMLLLGTISLDLANMIMMKRRLQSDLDLATLQAVKFLPDKSLASKSVENYLNLRKNYQAKLNITFEGDTLYAKAIKDYRLTLADAFLGKRSNFQVTANSSANSYPREVLVYIDSGNNVAPSIKTGEPLGNASKYPSATFFVDYFKDNVVTSEKKLRLITQQCFNPVFSAIKNTGIKLIDYFSNFSHVSIGVSFYPGIFSDSELMRPALFYSEQIENTNKFVDRKNFGYSYVSSTLCAASAENETNANLYLFPKESSDASKPSYRVDKSNYKFLPEYDPYLLPEEYIWMLPANEDRGSDFSSVLNRARHDLLSSKFREQHGNLKTKVKKVIVFISNTLPQVNGTYFPSHLVKAKITDSFDKYHKLISEFDTDISIFYVLINPKKNLINFNNADVLSFSNFLSSNEDSFNSNINLKLLVSETSKNAVDEIINILSIANKKSVLKS